jgi:membrane protein implicated in regulation of membrane protease activity
MEAFVRLLPGLIGLIAAWLAVGLIAWLGFTAWGTQLVVLILVYLVVTYLADQALKTYGRSAG